MATANEAERHGAVEGAGAGQGRNGATGSIGQQGLHHALLGGRAGTNQSIFRLEKNANILRQEIRDQRRNSNTEIHQHARSEALGRSVAR